MGIHLAKRSNAMRGAVVASGSSCARSPLRRTWTNGDAGRRFTMLRVVYFLTCVSPDDVT